MRVNSKDMRKKIVSICTVDRRCANDDKRLMAMIWMDEGWGDPELYDKLKNVSNPETIRRTRQKLVQEGLIKPSEQITEHRYQEFKRVREEI